MILFGSDNKGYSLNESVMDFIKAFYPHTLPENYQEEYYEYGTVTLTVPFVELKAILKEYWQALPL